MYRWKVLPDWLFFSQSLMFNGTDLSKTPCFKETMMATIGSSTLVAVAYNFATSKNPVKYFAFTYLTVGPAYW